MMKTRLPRTRWEVEARTAGGELLWSERADNLLPDAGGDFLLETFFRGTNYTAAWYAGLVADNPTFATADTALSHPGWSEVLGYEELFRPRVFFGAPAAKAISNGETKCIFTLINDTTIAGAFLSSTELKGGTGGVIYSEMAFPSGPKTVLAGGVLLVTVTVLGE